MKKFDESKKRIVAFIIVLMVIVFSPSETIWVYGSTCVKYDNQLQSISTSLSQKYVGENYELLFQVVGSWKDGHNVNVTISNTGSYPIRDWKCCFDYDANVVNTWNVEMIQDRNFGIAEACFGSWNRELLPKTSYTFGFTCDEEFKAFPKKCYVDSGFFEENCESDIETFVTNRWDGGCIGSIVIHNQSQSVIKDWMLEFDSNLRLDSVWNGKISRAEYNHIVLESMDYNCRIASGGSVSIGFKALGSVEEDIFTHFCLKVLSYEDDNETTDLSHDSNNENDVASNEIKEQFVIIEDEELGTLYYKPAKITDAVWNADAGLCYVNNQVLISAHQGVSKDSVLELIQGCGATMVGYIELTNDYQIEFTEQKNYKELMECVEWLSSNDLIAVASLNTFIEKNGDSSWTEYECNDLLYNDGIVASNVGGKETRYNWLDIDELSEERFHGDNWALKELNVPNAWKIVGKTCEQIKVGIYDVGFLKDTHEDLSNIYVYHNEADYKRHHGTLVAGIIGADHNDIGVAGVATNIQLHGWAMGPDDGSVMSDKVALATLVGKHARVINYSMGSSDIISYSVQMNIWGYVNSYVENGNSLSEFLMKLYGLGYDFVIVTSAGNGNNKKYSWDTSSSMYKIDSHGQRVQEIEAVNNSILNSITDPYLLSRIIVVAATTKEVNNLVYSANCVGERVDVYAPGVDVLSTVPVDTLNTDIPGYKVDRGTSFAAPHISGIAALMYQANPALQADQVKRIICDDNNSIGSYTDKLGVTRNMPDAEKCVKSALEIMDGKEPENLKNGILIGEIELPAGQDPRDVEIILSNTKDTHNPFVNKEYRFTPTEDGMFICSVPEGNYLVTINKDTMSSGDMYVIIKAEETYNLGKVKLISSILLINLKGKVSYSGTDISDAVLRFRIGINNKSGDYLLDENGMPIEVHTNDSGYYEVDVPEGEYTIEVIKDGYANEYENLRLSATEIEQKSAERNIGFTFKNEDTYKIVLSWEASAIDLDLDVSCISGPDTVCRISSKRNSNMLLNLHTRLMGDEDAEPGTETMLITGLDKILLSDKIILAVSVYDNHCPDGSYWGIHHEAKAKLSLYKNEELIQVFDAPSSADRKVWHAFNIREGDVIETVNRAMDFTP